MADIDFAKEFVHRPEVGRRLETAKGNWAVLWPPAHGEGASHRGPTSLGASMTKMNLKIMHDIAIAGSISFNGFRKLAVSQMLQKIFDIRFKNAIILLDARLARPGHHKYFEN